LIDGYVSQRHYLRHLLPVWHELPLKARGTLYIPEDWGVADAVVAWPRNSGAPMLVAGWPDLKRPSVLIEHGAGQHYSNGHPWYPGGDGRDWVKLFLCPNQAVVERNLAAYPDSCAEVVGAPALDKHFANPGEISRGNPPRVAVSFHWRCKVAPECDSAWDQYGPRSIAILRKRFEVLGHGHPRILEELRPHYEGLGIEIVDDIDDVLRRADIYVVDNSSTGFEAMALGIPVVWLNAPWYRRDVHHGLRFWEFAAAGVECNDPEGILDAVEEALEDPPRIRETRERAVAATYAFRDGSASKRAAETILRAMGSLENAK
jgi:glycosyltransferase involved in cell wall biosynthesis